MVRHNVQHLPQIRLSQPLAKPLVRLRTTQLLIHSLMIDDIVPMHTSRRCLQIRRTINMRDPERTQILGDPRRVVKCKFFMKLQPVSRTWNP